MAGETHPPPIVGKSFTVSNDHSKKPQGHSTLPKLLSMDKMRAPLSVIYDPGDVTVRASSLSPSFGDPGKVFSVFSGTFDLRDRTIPLTGYFP